MESLFIRNDKENINYILKEVTSTLEFTDSTCLGNDGCNDYRGYYVIEKNLIQFKHLGSTAKRCVGKEREVEEFIYKYFSKLYYETNSYTLILSDKSGVVFKYIKQK